MAEIDDDPAGPVVFDPLADLFFSVVAIVVLAVIVILPSVRLDMEAARLPQPERELRIDGNVTDPIRATATGIVYGSQHVTVPLDAIGEDAGLAGALRAARSHALPVVVLIEPDGGEAAFQLEPVLAREGPATVTEVRLAGDCSHVRQPTSPGARCPLAATIGPAR